MNTVLTARSLTNVSTSYGSRGWSLVALFGQYCRSVRASKPRTVCVDCNGAGITVGLRLRVDFLEKNDKLRSN